MTQREWALKGTITPQMETVACREGVDPAFILEGLAKGTMCLPANPYHRNLEPCAIGKGLRTKVNANLGTSSDYGSLETELEKLRVAVEYGSDTVMDLSTGEDIPGMRRAIVAHSPVAVGTVPIYQAAVEAIDKYGAIVDMTPDDLFRVIEDNARDGVDFMTVHCGITRVVVERLKRQRRVTDVVSRGGTFLIGWMLHNGKENPLYAPTAGFVAEGAVGAAAVSFVQVGRDVAALVNQALAGEPLPAFEIEQPAAPRRWWRRCGASRRAAGT